MNKQPEDVVRVMVVEDDVGTRERFAHAIASDARMVLVHKAGSGQRAIAQLAKARPNVLLVDLGLPDMHGTEVIRQAVRTLPGCDIMVITMFADEHNVLASIEAGATGYVLKDASDEDLLANILELRAGGAPMSPGIARMVLNRMHGRGQENIPAPAAASGQTALTAREIDVLNALSRGYTYAEIADRLEISLGTVTSHIKNSYRKLTVHSGVAAVMRATELGLLGSDTRKDVSN